ncbi:MAG TPA: glycoside hydrolase family 127 protein, partial [Caldithrix sp.]|nr:glycoside hydrolase family 127 protein [Caldithrix sp.]
KVILIFIIIYSCDFDNFRKDIPDYPISPVSFNSVSLADSFWNKRIEINRTATIPFGFNKCEEEGRIRNFAKAGGLMEGQYEGLMPFDDSDVYKIIEGASYSMSVHPDKKLDAYVDSIITIIAAAQEDDGYICTWKTLNPDTTPAWWVKPGPRWFNLASSHELYNVGHMYEAAYAHFQATGKRNFLNIALKNADLIADTFGPGKNMEPPGHQIIETGLIKLYRATGSRKYLDLAKFFLDQRGNAEGHELGGSYNQDSIPVIQQNEAVGHAVRAVYMYAGMADIAAIMRDSLYLKAIDKIWENVVSKKIYITGGLGARHQGESFGNNYELPNLTSYNETCAAIANVYWNHRMFLVHGHAKYIDVLERTLYNGLISGVSLDGKAFFYPNCLASDGKFKFNQGSLTRQPWFNCSCCPSNIIRFMPSIPGYIYAVKDNSIFVNLFIASEAKISLDGNEVKISQETNYPWDGNVNIKVDSKLQSAVALKIRIPGWSADNPVPSDLYRFLDDNQNKFSILLNGEPVTYEIDRGYVVLSRKWNQNDMLKINFTMPVRRVIAHELVKDDQGKVALTRGPIVYCAEGIDNNNDVFNLVIPNDVELTAHYQNDLLGGVNIINGVVRDKSGEKRQMMAIPYYSWSHRGPGEMTVWFQRNSE